MCWEWINILFMYIVDLLVDVLFNKACVDFFIKFIHDAGI